MRKLALMTAVFIAVSFMSGCNVSNKQTSSANEQTQALPKGVFYTCEMHRDVHLDKQGYCPKCGMKLVRSDSLK